MAMFRKPNWLKPEINEFKYWVHALVISVLILFVLNLFKAITVAATLGGIFSIKNILLLTVMIVISDVVAHTILGLD
jgi:hypothetical protein